METEAQPNQQGLTLLHGQQPGGCAPQGFLPSSTHPDRSSCPGPILQYTFPRNSCARDRKMAIPDQKSALIG